MGRGVLAEHGLAYWIEHNGRNILLDSGQGGVLAGNAYRPPSFLFTSPASSYNWAVRSCQSDPTNHWCPVKFGARAIARPDIPRTSFDSL